MKSYKIITKTDNTSAYDHDRSTHYFKETQSCLHDGCSECDGTGVKKNGSVCVHMISCPCPKCSPVC